MFSSNFCLQTQFIDKNNDALHTSLEVLVLESRNELVKTIFELDANNSGVKSSTKGKLSFISVGSKFRAQLFSLLEKLRSTVSLCTHSVKI